MIVRLTDLTQADTGRDGRSFHSGLSVGSLLKRLSLIHRIRRVS